MKTVLKLLLGVGSKDEQFEPTMGRLFLTAFSLLCVFFGSILFIIYTVTLVV